MKKILTIAAALLLCGAVYAQIDPTVEVSRHYKVNIADIERPQINDNSVADSLQKFDVDFDYSIFDRPYTDLYEFSPYQTDSIQKVVRRRPPVVMAQVGSQFPFAPELLLRSQLVTRPRLNIGINADVNAAACDLDYLGEEKALGAGRLKADLSAGLKHAWNTGEMTLMLDYKTDAYSDEYHGNQLNHGINSMALDFNVASANPKEGEVYYNLDFNYVLAGKSLSGLAAMDTLYTNSKMSVRGTIGSSFDKHRLYVDMIYQNAISGRDDNKVNVGLLEFVPTYEYAQKFFKIRAGARFGNKYIADDAATTIHPELDVKVELLRNTLWLRGVLSGGNELNSLVDYIYDAPWLCNGLGGKENAASDAIGIRNLESKISIESIIAGRFAFAPFVAYNNYSNKMQFATSFVETGLPILLPVYSNYAVTQLGFETSWKSKDLTISGNLVHNNAYTGTEEAVNMVPQWQFEASMEYNLKRRLFLNAAYTYQSPRQSWGKEIPDYSDLSVVITGVINRHFAVYLKGGNLLDNANYRFYAIPELPRNLGGGLRINF